MKKDIDVEFDEACDPDNPRLIQFDDIMNAHRRLVGQVTRTPCTKSHMASKLGMDLYIKQEFLQFTGCFKERGLRNTVLQLTDEQKKNGVISASAGNHGCAVSYHATVMGIPAVVCMPTITPITKRNRCQKFGAKLIISGNDMAQTKHHAMTIAKEKKMMYINGYDHPYVIEGQGTVGIEIFEQVPNVDAIIIPTGGGSLLTGVGVVAKHMKPDTEIYGVETDRTASMFEALKKDARVPIKITTTIAEGLAVNTVGVNTFHTIRTGGFVTKMVTVCEDWVARAIMHLVEEEKFVVEGAGATGLAAIMAGLLPNLKGKKVVIICTGGNIDTTTLSRILERGMAAEGRLVKFNVTVIDRPGGLAELCHLLAGLGVTMRDCVPERIWVKGDISCVRFKVIVESRGWDHTKELEELIKKNYEEYTFPEIEKDNKPSAKRGPCLAPNPLCMQKQT